MGMKMYPITFFSRKLSDAERNYDVGNRELLAVELALEKWRHWLEGAQYPFIVLTDHKNLEYILAAKRLIPRQAPWALFFTRFNFTLSYRPGSEIGKADALSRIEVKKTMKDCEDTILWDFDNELSNTLPYHTPEERLEDKYTYHLVCATSSLPGPIVCAKFPASHRN